MGKSDTCNSQLNGLQSLYETVSHFHFSAAKNRAVEAQYSGIAHTKSHAVFGTARRKETENNRPHHNLYQVAALCSEKILAFLLKLYGQALTVESIIQGYHIQDYPCC